ncbi:alpha-D-ribose 1-methylphosphonate 5-triphosphate diphosphatase [Bauldia litoralis]|uniref:Alpha-D-ribose 1-methylphosphonate 5-triphosphate diphosphatase n=1 Tax=Bauldia litoralis TaxID=665467 RepID=A0A1G6CU10_9HYPH|nr:alpha-D-ribose 1-methylphosphonate 5-triphosphate diphosphatase [Bauldia litoralis]SDB36331.1 alpha-D-ribose 1-methylphosphonate 5-triphosphate diphosphatase [Bauldia litoralis]
MTETIFRNGRVVLPETIHDGDVVVRDGMIAEIADAGIGVAGIDLEGDWLLPGLVELHTDHIEGHYAPRPKVRWNPSAAAHAHDAQIASSGITTVLDALRIGMDEDSQLTAEDMKILGDAIASGQERGSLRADHYIHLRCEVCAPDVLEGFAMFADEPLVRLASLMDHTPGQRQFTSMDTYRTYYQGKTGMSDSEFERFVASRQARAGDLSDVHRKAIAGMCREKGIVLASHDDATEAHVAEAADYGVALAEFPTTMEAAAASRAAGLKVLMGAPNIVRGGSHSGNIAAGDLARAGMLDVLSSDYFPFSLLHSIFVMAETVDDVTLPAAVALVSRNPAEAAGFTDRGAIEAGRRADLVQVRVDGDHPVVRAVWRQGRRVA